MARRPCTPVQLELRPRTWGGRRKGAGRRPSGHAGVRHGKREALSSRHPVHVTLRVRADVGALRRRRVFSVVRRALREGCDREGFRVCHFNVLSNHIHTICEAKQAEALSRGVQGLEVRLARGINKELGRSGRVFADRYHSRALKTPSEVRACLVYVLQNQLKHVGARATAGLWFDFFSSAPWFGGWKEPLPTDEPWMREALQETCCVAPAHCWLLTEGWRRRKGPLSLAARPADATAGAGRTAHRGSS